MENVEQAHSPSNEELEDDAERRFEAYEAIKAEHGRRKDDLKKNFEREKTRIDTEVQKVKDRLKEDLEVLKVNHAAAIEDESRNYHAELKRARRPSGPEMRPEHSPSIEEMEAEEARLFEAFKRVKTTHARRVRYLQGDLESQTANIQKQVDGLGQESTRCLADHNAAMEEANQRYMVELKEFKRQRNQAFPAESVCQCPLTPLSLTDEIHQSLQHRTPDKPPLSQTLNLADNITYGGSAATSLQSQEESDEQPGQGSESRNFRGGNIVLGSPLGGPTPSQQRQQFPLPSSSSSASRQPTTAWAPSADIPQTPSSVIPPRKRKCPTADVSFRDQRGRWHKGKPEWGPASRVAGGE